VIQRRAEGKRPLGPPPPEPDFEKLAKEAGIGAGRTGLISQWEAQNADIGGSLVEGRTPVWYYAWQSLAKFRPENSQDLQGKLYLFWKTEDVKEYVPKFDEPGMREEVLMEWKIIRARKFAMAQAESLAKEADKASGKSLKQTFAAQAELHVISPPPFSWMTFGNVALTGPQEPRRSSIEGVEMPGQEFMRTVFHLQPEQAAAVFNEPQSIAYAVRLAGFTPSYKVLLSQFEVDDFSKYASVGVDDQRQIDLAWLNDVQKSAGFEWVGGHQPEQTPEAGQPVDE
jgi:hypothetical protein